ncbi:hypothetical protein ABZ638_31940 [Streptomyces sp. NPDC007107]|uniref:hypothetical protein n=1 Tax=Streptomyces sp. NPDC007107 TaxID=3156915 RepID=UPI0033EF177B
MVRRLSITDCWTPVNHSDRRSSVPGHCMAWSGDVPSGEGSPVALQVRRPRGAHSFLHGWVGQLDRPAERGEHPVRLQERGHA